MSKIRKIVKEILEIKVTIDPNNLGEATLDVKVLSSPLNSDETKEETITYSGMRLDNILFNLDDMGSLKLCCHNNNITITIDKRNHLETINL